jgi:hypothetical protein
MTPTMKANSRCRSAVRRRGVGGVDDRVLGVEAGEAEVEVGNADAGDRQVPISITA